MNWLDRKGVSSPAKIVSAFCLFCLSGFFLIVSEGVASETPQPLHDAVSSGLPYFPVQPPDSPTGQTDKASSSLAKPSSSSSHHPVAVVETKKQESVPAFDMDNPQAKGSIIGFLVIIGFLILLFFWGLRLITTLVRRLWRFLILLFSGGLRSSGPSRCQIEEEEEEEGELWSSGPSRCQICDLEFGAEGREWNVVIDGKNFVICSRCQRKLENKRHSEKFKDFWSQFVSNRRGSTNPNDRRERVASDVKKEVWNRDGGKCVECGSREDLEYDHIIPVSKGGANTVRNVQLLCEKCNRSKSANIQ